MELLIAVSDLVVIERSRQADPYQHLTTHPRKTLVVSTLL